MNWLTQRFSSQWIGWLESILAMLIVIGCAQYWRPHDPFFLNAPFPWLWFIPILMALRYGIGPGLASVVVLVGAFIWHEAAHNLELYYNRMYLLSGFILTLVCAEFRAYWSIRIKRAEAIKDYAEYRLDMLARSYYLVRYSHDHLEQSLISKPVTLRAAMTDLRRLLRQPDLAQAEVWQEFLALLSYYCSLESCALYLCQNNKFKQQAIAFIKASNLLDQDDPLFEHAIETQQTAYHAKYSYLDEKKGNYLIAAPLITSENQYFGMLTVSGMAFLNYTEENIELLMVLLSYFANQSVAIEQSKDLINKFTHMPADFAAEVIKLQALDKDIKVNSHVIAFYFPKNDKQNQSVDLIKEQQRGLDFSWEFKSNDDAIVLVILLPFTKVKAVQGYLDRVDRLLMESASIRLNHNSIQTKYIKLASDKVLEQQLMQVINFHD